MARFMKLTIAILILLMQSSCQLQKQKSLADDHEFDQIVSDALDGYPRPPGATQARSLQVKIG